MQHELPAPDELMAQTDPGLEVFARLVRATLQVPVALVSLVSQDGHMFSGALGLPEPFQTQRSTPLTHSLCQHVVTSGRSLVVADAREHPLTAGSAAIPDLGLVAYAGQPLTDAAGVVVGSLCAIDHQPRAWSEHELEMLADLARACSAQLRLQHAERTSQRTADHSEALLVELAAQQQRWRSTLTAAGVGSWDWHLPSATLTVDERLLDIYGHTGGELSQPLEFFRSRLHPDDRDRVARAVSAAVAENGPFAVEGRIVLPDGRTRWIQARGQIVPGPDGHPERIIGGTWDTTAGHEEEGRTARVLQTMPTGYLALDGHWRFTAVNDAAERILGRTREELLGSTVHQAFPAHAGSEFEAAHEAAVATGRSQTVQAFYPDPLNAWFEVLCVPTPDGLALFFTDTTEAVLTSRRAEAATARLALLELVNRALLDATDLPATVADLPRLLVPALADGCVLTLLAEDGRPQDVGCAHADPAKQAALHQYSRLRIQAQSLTSPLARVLTGGQPVRATVGEVRDGLLHDEAAQLLDAVDPAVGLYLPIHGRGRLRGALTFFSGAGRPRNRDDEDLAAQIAERVGVALDTAALLAAQSQVAEGLQRSLLTEPPEPDHAEVVVRYVPATESAKVGGDWYDAFLQTSGRTVLVIGDVVGHDIDAAAAMGQLRGLLRGIAAYSDAGPAEVLRGLDAAMQLLQIPTLATAAIARFEQTPDELAEGTTRMVWSNAGHPAPVILHPDGTHTVLAEARSDLLLGVDPHTTRAEQSINLQRGATVLLYTDGLIERRTDTLDDGLTRLTDAITGIGPAATLNELADGVIDRLHAGRNDDDIALVAVRLHRQDRPRPTHAGPNDIPPELPPDPAAE